MKDGDVVLLSVPPSIELSSLDGVRLRKKPKVTVRANDDLEGSLRIEESERLDFRLLENKKKKPRHFFRLMVEPKIDREGLPDSWFDEAEDFKRIPVDSLPFTVEFRRLKRV